MRVEHSGTFFNSEVRKRLGRGNEKVRKGGGMGEGEVWGKGEWNVSHHIWVTVITFKAQVFNIPKSFWQQTTMTASVKIAS